jgi:hypothetical protein
MELAMAMSRMVQLLPALWMFSASQQAPPARVHLTGKVIAAQTQLALRHARVAIDSTSTREPPTFTDDRGEFALDAPLNTSLTIAKAGFATETVPISRGQGLQQLRIEMRRGGAITGRAVDQSGLPVISRRVTALLLAPDAVGPMALSAITDDLGEFRFGGLAQGEWKVELLPPVRVRSGEMIDVGDLIVAAGPPTVTSAASAAVPSGFGAITGQVTDVRGKPMRVILRLSRTGSPTLSAVSDDKGRFRFERLAEGSYFLEAARPGAPTMQFGQRYSGQPGKLIDVRDRATVSDVNFVLSGGTSISGSVGDEYGEPIQGASVRVLQIRSVDGRKVAIAPTGIEPRTSDDRGVYRMFGLLPGRYLVVVDGDAGYAPTFYSGTSNVAYALPVNIEGGDVSGIDLALHPEPTARVFGTALDSDGRPVVGPILMAVSQRSGVTQLEPRQTSTSADGTFLFENVSPGDYVLQTMTPSGGVRPRLEPGKPLALPAMEFGMQRLVIATDSEPPAVSIRTSRGSLLRGRIVTDGQSPLPPSLRVWPFPTDFDTSPMIGSGAAALTMKQDSSFEISGITGTRRFVLMTAVDGWYLREARVRGVDALDTPYDFGVEASEFDDIEVVASRTNATVFGTATNAAGRRIDEYVVLLFSMDSSKWYRMSQGIKLARPSQNGEFRISSVPPGSYYLVAVPEGSDLIASGNWQDASVLQSLRSSAATVVISEQSLVNVALRLVER